MRKKLPAIVVLLLTIFPILGIAQINSEQVDPGPYGWLSNITVPNQLSISNANFAATNTFTLYLSDASGNFGNERVIGSFVGFFSRFINGVIPGDAVAGNAYRIRIKSSNPVAVHEFSTPFQVVAAQGPGSGITAPANLSLGTDAFGWCGTSTGDNKSILFGIAANAPPTQTLTFKNEVTGTTGTVPASSVGYDLNGISKDYYTLRVNAERVEAGQTIKSNKSYLLLNQPTQVSPISGDKTGCIDPALGTGVDINFAISVSGNGGIQNNYPGSIYRVNWGDKQESTYTHAEVLRLKGELIHNYKNSSCGEPPIDLGTGIRLSNSFKISITSQNAFCSTISNPVTSYAQIYAKPVAKIDTALITAVCVNKPVLFSNKSIPGTNANCSTGMTYRWYVDGVLASDRESFVFAGFATTGTHTVRLVVSNDVGSCSPSEDRWTICVQNPPRPSFNLGTNTTACVGTIFRPENTSYVDNSCNSTNSFRWEITGGPVTYVNNTTATSEKPEFSFNTPGIYKIKLVAKTASCGEVVTEEQTIIINGTPTATLSPNAQLCSLGTYKFSDIGTGPTVTKFSGTQQELADTYTWTVSGGEYEIESSTANTKFPSIKFLEYKTYTVTVTHKNSCGTETKTQTISFIPSPTIDIQTADTICFDDPIALRAVITGEASTQTWVGGNGTFSAGRDALVTDYIPTAAERAAGRVELKLRITTALAAPCAVIEKSVVVIIRPKAAITSAAAIANCNNAPLNYTITSNLPGTTYTWTATGPASVTGFTSGSGTVINDVLVNANGSVDATVIYTITPLNNGCPGTPFTLTATIGNIKNDISSSIRTICSGQEITIAGNDLSTLAGYRYVWERSLDGGATWTAIDNQNQKDLKLTITNTQLFRRSVSGGNCSAVSETIQINVLPPLENNILSEVPAVCEGFAAAQLTGSVPTGGDGNFNFQWQRSTNGGTTWTNIDAAVLPAYQPGILSATTLFRRLVSTTICSGPFQSVSNPITVTVNPKPKAEFTAVLDKSCAPFLINAQNLVAKAYPDRNDIYSWYANDVLIGTGINFPNYTITTDNTSILIKLVVSSRFGCSSDSTSRVFSTQQTATASFSQNIEEICGPGRVTFRNTTPTIPGTTYFWDFGNGVTTNVANPVPQNYLEHSAGRDTTYTVKLTVRNVCGDNTFTSRVLVKALPRAVFSPSKTTGCSPMVVTFTNTSPGTGNTYYYDFGDGTPPLRKTDNTPVTHTFVSGSIKDFVVSMITENSCGRSEPTTYKIRVSPNTVIPELVVNSDELAGCAPFTVNFHNNSSGATSYVYDFGDGTKAGPTRTSPETITHTFTKGGVFVVTLTASNGCSDTTTTETITVYDQPMLQIAADQVQGCPGLNVKFKNESVGGISYVWDFGDGSPTSTEFAPSHVYTGDKEFYTVTLTAVNALGCSNIRVFNQFVHIIPPPVAKFNVVPGTTINIPNYTFQFEDESENNPDSWSWDFGDGTTSNTRSPKHTYPDTGSYTVKLRVTNQFNCYTEVSKVVKIVGVPGYLFVPNAFIPNSGTEELRTFKAKGSGLATYTLSIFNKWGELLWQTDKLEEGRPVEGWDGTYKSSLAPQGTYIWKIDAEFINKMPWKGMSLNGSAPKRTGTINLIR